MVNIKTELMLGGAKTHYKMFMLELFKHKHIFKNHTLTVYDGISNCSWNGGRINRDIDLTDNEISNYYKHNINIALTFSNHNIDLTDQTGNELLKKFHKKGNSIILINENLRKYIKKNFPLYRLIYSITGLGTMTVPMNGDDVKRYKVLEDKYDMIVPRMEHVFDKEFLKLKSLKYEVMMNDTCVYACPYFEEHFQLIADQNHFKKPWEEKGELNCTLIEECWLKGFNPDTGDQKTIEKYGDDYGMDLNKKQLMRLYDLGIRSYKITGRENKSPDMKDDLHVYLDFIKDFK